MPDNISSNKNIASLLRRVADAYLLSGENRFRVLAYQKAADSVEHLSREIGDMQEDGQVDKIPGIGKTIAAGIEEALTAGKSKHFEDIINKFPPQVYRLTGIGSIGPKRALALVRGLGLENSPDVIGDTIKAGKENRIMALPGFGKKSQDEIIAALLNAGDKPAESERLLLSDALAISNDIAEFMEKEQAVEKIVPLGSLRRQNSTIGDIDLATATEEANQQKIISHFIRFPGSRKTINAGGIKSSIELASGIRVDLRVQPRENFGSMLQYFTGSKAHNIRLREFALRKGFSLSEYGIKKIEDGKLFPMATEKEFYNFLGLDYIPPEIREGTDEIQLALEKKLPKLADIKDIKGDFHLHSDYDLQSSHDMGENTFAQMIDKAEELGYEYIGFSEHNPRLATLESGEAVEILRLRKYKILESAERKNIKVLIGTEVDILKDGRPAFPEKALDFVDYLIMSVHGSMRMPADEMTGRVLKALSFPKAKIFGHPTTRLIGRRPAIDTYWERIFDFCLHKNIALEINANPYRLDLPDILVKQAVANGNKLAIGSDAHAVSEMELMPYGVGVARRGWARKSDIINTMEYDKIMAWFNK